MTDLNKENLPVSDPATDDIIEQTVITETATRRPAMPPSTRPRRRPAPAPSCTALPVLPWRASSPSAWAER